MENSHDVVLKKLDKLLGNRVDHMYNTKPEFDEAIYERMFNFITSLEPDQISEDQAATIVEMIEDIEIEFEGEDEDIGTVDEVRAKRVKRDKQAARERKREYRKNKAKLKQKAKRYRKSAKGKIMAKKAKRKAKTGKTATGKKKRTYIN